MHKMKTNKTSYSETWLVQVLFYLVLLRWLIEKFRLWNKVEMDKNKKN